MYRRLLAASVILAILLISASVVFALGPAPSWQLTEGKAGTCSSTSGFSLPGVQVNIPVKQASEQGVLSAPGYPNLGFTTDSAFGPFVGPLGGFFVFATAPYSLPANTILTLSVTTYNATGFAGGVSYVSTISWNCTTGALVVLDTACPNPLLAGSVMAEAPLGAQVYWGPSANQQSPGVVLNPGTYYVMGMNDTGEYAKVWLTCQSVFWVRTDALQPSYQAPWSGQPLPTRVVS